MYLHQLLCVSKIYLEDVKYFMFYILYISCDLQFYNFFLSFNL